MLSYRHAFHAGNHADVLKHAVLVQIARYLAQKEKPFWYIDTHAGAGEYALDSGFALQKKEYLGGIDRLWRRDDLPPVLADYLSIVRRANPDGRLRNYPGSARFALSALRQNDRLRLFELHGRDAEQLARRMKTAGPRAHIERRDGFSGLVSVLPPPSRRALVLIDPSYEEKQDYGRVVQTVKTALARFSTGIYVVWYPQIARLAARELPSRLTRLPGHRWLHVGLTVCRPARDGFGLYGSGLVIFNPPFTLRDALSDAMPWLSNALGLDSEAGFMLETEKDSVGSSA